MIKKQSFYLVETSLLQSFNQISLIENLPVLGDPGDEGHSQPLVLQRSSLNYPQPLHHELGEFPNHLRSMTSIYQRSVVI